MLILGLVMLCIAASQSKPFKSIKAPKGTAMEPTNIIIILVVCHKSNTLLQKRLSTMKKFIQK